MRKIDYLDEIGIVGLQDIFDTLVCKEMLMAKDKSI
jgi:hypothetical protein